MKIKLFLLTLLTILLSFSTPTQAASSSIANSFTFDSFTADYYLLKNPDDTSSLHVKEELVANFPDHLDTNHGIERRIPYTNQDGHNLTIKSPNELKRSLKVTRDGHDEPYSVSLEDGYYNVRIGNADTYVHGKQTYTIEYDFSNVITEFTENDKTYQELYWDTNGIGWSQPFGVLTARIHFPDSITIPDKNHTWCYVGQHYSSDQDRCEITKTNDGFTYVTHKLGRWENLTFDLELPANSFTIPSKPDNYIYMVILGFELILIAAFSFLVYYKSYLPNRDKYQWYKTAPVAPQYTPLKNYTAAHLGKLYLEKNPDTRIATLLELAVQHKITIIKGEKHKLGKKHHWSIRVDTLDNLSSEQLDLLKFLIGNKTPTIGETYALESYAYSSSLEQLYRSYDENTLKQLENLGDFTSKTTKKSHGTLSTILVIIFFILFGFCFAFSETIFKKIFFYFSPDYYHIIAPWLLPIVIILPIAALIIHIHLHNKFKIYTNYTQQGLEHANYVAGLKLYIEMAEADRIKFLQSVDGADTSDQGIVKLYEKLLPYAAIFNLEQTWLAEMQKYYKLAEIPEPDWYNVGLAYALANHDFSNNLSRPIDPSSSSSGSSGSGGGGFSGGGGGGGGGGGW